MIEEIREILLKYYEDGDRGCYVNGVWLSVDNIIRILKEEL
jgi:hypothetical protein